MPKSQATNIVPCLTQTGRVCAALSALFLLPAAVAAVPEPSLRRSEQIDLRRLGKVSEDERSVLRIEWRVGLTGVDEANGVQDMLDNLRRIEQTMVAVSLLVRNMPTHQPVVAPVAAEPAPADDGGTRLMVANLAAAGLVALWWFRRRKSAAPKAQTAGARMGRPSGKAATDATSPTEVQASPFAQAMQGLKTAPRIEPRVPTEDLQAEAVAAAAAPTPAANTAAAPLPEAKPVASDFSLEHADPESVAREAARQPAAAARAPARAASGPPETGLEPTLQLAEIMLSMGLEQGAAQALVEYTEANPRHALYHWLKLLGIYRKRGLNREFAETAEQLRKNFNIQAEFSVGTDTGEAPTLEKFSRVAEHVQTIWARPQECIDYLRRLLEDNRDGARAGFPQSVAEEIILLIEILKEETPDSAQAAAT
ncbi:MAG: hypothetical protein Q8S20_11095 [Sulfuritalea sp.]|nr:hypothetical protein [Sulfuritalea sp.]